MKIRGANLGNWLVLEKWLGGSPLAGASSPDERGLLDELPREELERALTRHRQTYVTSQTFRDLAARGTNLVRIPVPYYLFGTQHHAPCVQYLDLAFSWAEAVGMGVLVDLHTVPGGQNGFDNSGVSGLCTWHKDPSRIEQALHVLAHIAERYAGSPSLFGIEPLNEPASPFIFRMNMERYGRDYPERVAASQPIPRATLEGYYLHAYQLVHAAAPQARVVLHDAFDLSSWDDFMSPAQFPNVWIDTHKYLNFCEHDMSSLTLAEYVRVIHGTFAPELEAAEAHHPVLVGEWSLGNHSQQIARATPSQRDEFYRTLAREQLRTWDLAEGGCFWNFRIDVPGKECWSLASCLDNGWVTYVDADESV